MPIPNSNNNYGNHFPQPNKGGSGMSKIKKTGLIILGVTLLLTVIGFNTISFVEVNGHQAAVVENQFSLLGLLGEKGVQEQTLGPGKHFIIPFAQHVVVYNVGTDNFVMGDDKYYSGKGTDFTDFGALEIKCRDGKDKEQPAFFSFTLQYNINKTKLKKLHSESGKQYKDRVIKPAIVRIINDLATPQNVLDFYAGNGKTKLQQGVYDRIRNDPTLAGNGINVTTFVFDNIGLDSQYEEDILGRQRAIQKELRVNAEKKVEIANAAKVREASQAAKYKRVAEAEAERQEREEAAKAKAFEVTQAAEAQAKSVKAAAKADAFRKTQNAIALKKEGLAKAAVANALKTSKYAGVAGQRQYLVDVETAKSDRLKNANISGVVTEKTFMMLTDGKNVNTPNVTIPNN